MSEEKKEIFDKIKTTEAHIAESSAWVKCIKYVCMFLSFSVMYGFTTEIILRLIDKY